MEHPFIKIYTIKRRQEDAEAFIYMGIRSTEICDDLTHIIN